MKKRKSQKGFSKILLIVGGAIILLTIVSIASGALKGGISVTRNGSLVGDGKRAAELETYQNAQAGITFEYSADWTLKDNPGDGVLVALMAPKESSEDQFIENLNLSLTNVSSIPDLTTASAVDILIQQNKSDYPEGVIQVLSREGVTLAEMPAEKIIYSLEEQGFSVQIMSVVMVYNQTNYVINYTAETKNFGKFLAGADQVIKTLRLE